MIAMGRFRRVVREKGRTLESKTKNTQTHPQIEAMVAKAFDGEACQGQS
jgi:hypothetical protein